jgi:hypothetical protein
MDEMDGMDEMDEADVVAAPLPFHAPRYVIKDSELGVWCCRRL